MNSEPPKGTIIEIERTVYSTIYSWKNGKKGFLQYPVAAFMIFWLGGWTVGGFMAAKTLFTNNNMPLFGKLFMLFWLGGWAFGEAAVIYMLYCFFRPLKPARLTLSRGSIEYQTGTKSFNSFNYSVNRQSYDRPKFFQGLQNKSYRIEAADLGNLRLDRIGERQRLTFDVGAKRIEIGEPLSEPEREWLYEIIQNHISE